MYATEIFPEFGKECRLLTPYRGYRYATIIDIEDCLFIVQVSSGASFHVYPDEIEILD
ncbi:MAG: glyoxalase [Bacteroidales bacterium]|nr:glyoxalase [Bacteroidales bacterium]